MLAIILRKFVQGALMLLAVSALTFTLLSAAGGDALSTLRDNPQISERTIEYMRVQYGLDRPLAVRYASWLGSALTGDLGESISYKTPVASLVWAKFLNTAIIGIVALGIAVSIAFALGTLSVRYKGTVLSSFTDGLVVLLASIPALVLAIAALVLTARVVGNMSRDPEVLSGQFVLAAIALALPFVAITLSQFRAGLQAAENEDFTRLARAKGLDDWAVLLRHTMRAALNPFLTVTGLSFGTLLSGAVIVESIMGWPGIGPLLVNAVRARDVPLVMGMTLFASLAVWVGNTSAELLQAVNDPRLSIVEDTGKAA